MPLKATCDGCGEGVLGVFSSLKKIDGRYLCSMCATNPSGKAKYYCNACQNHTAIALKKGSTIVEIILYLFYIIPGIIYSIWRRQGPPNVCPLCRSASLVPEAVAKPLAVQQMTQTRDEVDCPFCAEKILARAVTCKHCGKKVRV